MKKNSKLNIEQIELSILPTVGFYFVIFLISIFVDHKYRIFMIPQDSHIMLVHGFLALFVSIVVLGVMFVLGELLPSFKKLSLKFKEMFMGLSVSEAFFLAAFSSMAEELFFRGVLQHYWGIAISSLVFGILHSGPSKDFRIWTLSATLMGFLLAYMYAWSENICVPIAIHFFVNLYSLISMSQTQKITAD